MSKKSKSEWTGYRLPDPCAKSPSELLKDFFFSKTPTGRKMTNEILATYIVSFLSTMIGANALMYNNGFAVAAFLTAGIAIAFTFPKADKNIQAGYLPLLHKVLFALSSVGEFIAIVFTIYSILYKGGKYGIV